VPEASPPIIISPVAAAAVPTSSPVAAAAVPTSSVVVVDLNVVSAPAGRVAKRARLDDNDPGPSSGGGGGLVTAVNGITYRSRLEARFSIFLAKLGVAFEYESTTFEMLGGRYTPDFYLPAQRTWIELKPAYPLVEEMSKCMELCRRGFHTVLMYGALKPPFEHQGLGGKRTYDHAAGMRGMAWDDAGKRVAGDVAFAVFNDRAAAPRLCAVTEPVEMDAACHDTILSAMHAADTHVFHNQA
jgi:hypothetical protein